MHPVHNQVVRDKPQKTLFSGGFSRDILKQYSNINYVNKIRGKEIKFHKLQIFGGLRPR